MIAFVFPGQGAQHVGMGVAMAEQFPQARRVFDEASAALDLDLLALCRDGPEEVLRETEHTQPALLTCSWAIATVVIAHGIAPQCAAGLSLGEYTALVAARALDLADAVRVVRIRGRYMQDAVTGRPTAMAAVLGLEASAVEEVCREAGSLVELANINAPGQVVIAGDRAAVEAACARLKLRGARRAVPLAVSAPFHTSLMQAAADRLAPVLAAVPLRDAAIPVVANATAEPVREAATIRRLLIAQIASPVRWEQCVRRLHALGATTFVEAGPGTTLAGLIRRTLPGVQVLSVQTPADLEAARAALAGPVGDARR
ncbi:MAG: ACP S-malonyltransferase [Armatimonadota bacterium]|nr:ACP S-malonyltransferase [Armatimonadota bacterium]MDR7535327.1 ACP S-malonyltransferase [Armatimonadota bacterium]